MFSSGVIVQGWIGGCGCCFGSLCLFVSLMLLVSFFSGPFPWIGQLWYFTVTMTCLGLCICRSLTVLSFLFDHCWLSLLFSPPFRLIILYAGYWPLRVSLLLWSVLHSLYACCLYVWFCQPLTRLMYLLIYGMLRLLWFSSALTAGLPFFRFGLVLGRSLGRFVPVYLIRRFGHPFSA